MPSPASANGWSCGSILPTAGNAWHLAVFASGAKGELVPIEHAIVDAGSGRARLEDETARLERMLPALAATRRHPARPGDPRARTKRGS